MSAPLINLTPALSPNPMEQIGRTRGKTLESEKARLKKATQEFESFFSHQMLKTMRQTIPKSEDSKKSGFSNDFGKETWTDMFDVEVSRAMAGSSSRSISDVLYQSLERLIEAEFGQSETKEMLPFKRLPETLKVKPLPINRGPINLPEQLDHLELPTEPLFKLNHQAVRPVQTTDTITARYGDIIDLAAAETKLDSTIIASVIEAESAGDPQAESKAGAKGLMQLMDATAGDLGVTDAFDPKENIMAGSRYLKEMLTRFGDLKTALAAYNAGPGNVDKYGGIPPFSETEQYVERVTSHIARRSGK